MADESTRDESVRDESVRDGERPQEATSPDAAPDAAPDDAAETAGEPLGPAGRLASFFIDSKLTPLLVVAALLLGALAIQLTPREEEPQIVVPMVDLFVQLPGASAVEVENRVTVPLEKRLWEIPGVEYVYSASQPGQALVTVRFLVGDDLEASLVKVYEKLASGLDRMPPGASPPLVRLRTIDDVPVLALTLWSERYGGYELRQVGEELAREVAKLQDVSEVTLHGGERRVLRVILDPAALASRGLDAAAVVRALGAVNVASRSGSFETGPSSDAGSGAAAGAREVLVETGAFLTRAEEVRDLVVGVSAPGSGDGSGGGSGAPITLGEVARVVEGPEEPASYTEILAGPAFGAAEEAGPGARAGVVPDSPRPAVTLAVAKRQGADAQRVVTAVEESLEELGGALLPPDVEVTVTRNYGETATEKADELLVHLFFAVVSVTLVIGLFLGWRGALVVFVSVPVSFALTLFVYYAFGYTLNRVTLFALVFVTGIVVDDSIIVVENIVRHLAEKKPGVSRLRTALEAVSEVGNPTILATLTVIAAVLPMAFVRGLMGPYMRPMPVGASLAMVFSLAVALVVAPWFTRRLLGGGGAKDNGDDDADHDVDHDDAVQDNAVHGAGDESSAAIRSTRTFRVYRGLVEPLLETAWKRWAFLGGVTALLLAAVALFPARLVEVKMLPFDNKSELQVLLDMPEGTPLEATHRVARELAEELRTVPEVTDLQIYAGTAAPINFNGLVRHYDLRRGPTVADLQVNFVHKGERDERSHDLAQRIRPPLAAIAERHGGALKVVEVPPGPPVLSTLVAEVYGPGQEARLALAGRVRELFEGTDGVVDVDWMVEAPQEKVVLVVDREKAALAGVAPARVVDAVALAFGARPVGTLHREDAAHPVPIVLELARAERSGIDRLLELPVASETGALVPLAELVEERRTVLEPTRHRKNLRPVTYVTADVAGAVESPVYAILEMAETIEGFGADGGEGQGETGGGAPVQLWTAQPVGEEELALKWDGEWHITYEVFRDLGTAFGVVLILIYLLLVGWFGSFRTPLVMMIAIPLSLVGIVPGHMALGAFFTATSMIGFIALAGIMVRNSVLLIDFVELARRRGAGLADAVLEAGAVRFRPILLTAGTVMVGAMVILFDPIFEGLAISLMFGTLASTVLTLGVVPVVYAMLAPPGTPDGGGD